MATNDIAGQTNTAYENYKKLKTLVDVGYFLIDYVVSGGVVTKDVTYNNVANVTEIVAALDNDVTRREATSFKTIVANTTYYLDYMSSGDFNWDTAHYSGSYLPVAQVTTDANKNVLVITDMRGEIGGLRLKDEYMPPEIATRVVDLFAMAGQSNMQGKSEGAPVPFELPNYKAYEYKLLTDSFTTVKHPFGEEIAGTLVQAFNGWGSLSPRFAEAYFNTTGIAPLMVGAASGSYIATEWLTHPRYAKVVEKTNAAVVKAAASNLVVRNKCFVWLHGETDGMTGMGKQTYKNYFLELWSDFKRDCGFNKCLIIRVTNFGPDPMYQILEAQEELARENDDIIMLTRITGTFTVANGKLISSEDYHYTNAGLDLVGTTAGKAAGRYLELGIEPTLETEPYPGAEIAAVGFYEFRYRNGTIGEGFGSIATTAIGTPTITPDYVEFNGSSGVRLGKPIILDGDATISVTCLIDSPLPTGTMFLGYDGSLASDYIFVNHNAEAIFLTDSFGMARKFYQTADMISGISTYNHYCIQKSGKVYALYFNNALIQTIYNGPEVLNLNTIFFAGSLGLNGKAKHCYINRGAIVPPKEADPVFYSLSEEGTT